MRTVRDVMQGDVEVLRTSETVAEAAGVLAAQREDWLPLCRADGSLAGAVSHRDIVAEVVAKGRDPREVRLAELAELSRWPTPVTWWPSTSTCRSRWPSP